jgi:uncharacterized membrane protein YcaP (DUF421 family)
MPIWIVILIRSSFMFFITLILLRMMGKRQPTKMSPFTMVNYLVIAILAALLSITVIPNLMLGLIALGVWTLFSMALDYLALKSKVIHDLLTGKETVLIKQGKIMEENLFHVRLTGEELLRELRSKNFFSLAEVEFAVMETTGDINVLPKSDYKPVTSHNLGTKVAPQSESQTVILDGNIMDEPLASLGLNRTWLKLQLEKFGISVTNVFIGQVDSTGELFVDLFDDSIILPLPKVKELLYVNLEKVQADLSVFALETNDPRAKVMYSENSAKLQILLEKIKPYLLR